MDSSTQWTCTCGRHNGDDAAFCAGCGSPRPAAAAEPEAFCPECGHERAEAAAFCASCGHKFDAATDAATRVLPTASEPAIDATTPMPTAIVMPAAEAGAAPAPMPPVAPTSKASPSGNQQRLSTGAIIGIIVGAVVLIALIAGIIVLATNGDDSTKKSSSKSSTSASAKVQLDSSEAAIVAAHRQLQSTLASAGASQRGIAAVRTAGTALESAASTALQAIDGLKPTGKQQQRATLLRALVVAEKAYGTAAAQQSSSPDNVGDRQLSTLTQSARDVSTSWDALVAGGFRPADALTVASTDADRFTSALRAYAEQTAKLRSWARSVESVLTESSSGRGDLTSIFADVQRCNLTPDDARSQLLSIASNRQAVLSQIAALDPPDAASRRATSQLQSALQHSHEADRHYADWVSNQTDWYYTEPVGCPSGKLPEDSFHAAADSESAQASTAKRAFTSTFNPIARRFAMRTWTESQI